jgi:enamine deaminase RidA (YjgF/YER057c/UK114 family)
MKQARNAETVHKPVGRYVHSIEVSAESRLLFVSGQVGMDSDGTVPDDAASQLVLALRNVLEHVKAAGFEPRDVVKLTTYCVSEVDRDTRRRALDDALGEHFTASTLVFVPRLVAPEYLVEIEAWASR